MISFAVNPWKTLSAAIIQSIIICVDGRVIQPSLLYDKFLNYALYTTSLNDITLRTSGYETGCIARVVYMTAAYVVKSIVLESVA